eukprot:scaffold80980_cov75-Attheya_sp.AAC.1
MPCIFRSQRWWKFPDPPVSFERYLQGGLCLLELLEGNRLCSHRLHPSLLGRPPQLVLTGAEGQVWHPPCGRYPPR